MVKLSIVIPYYNTLDLTKIMLNTLLPQLTKEVEVFLIDDGCNEKELDSYNEKINVIHLDKNVGGASAMNIGIQKAKGKYIAIIDSDDNISNDYIETLLDTINNQKEDVIYFDWQDIGNGAIVRHPSNYAPWKAIYKKEVMPLFRDGWRYSYDVPFQEDLSLKDYSRFYIDKVLYFYNSNRDGSLTLEKEKIRRKNMIRCEVIEDFTLRDFDKLENIQRKRHNEYGKLFVGDTFTCNEIMADYLTGNNALNKVVVKVIEVAKNELTEKETKVVEDLEKAKDIMEKPKKTKSSKRKAM